MPRKINNQDTSLVQVYEREYTKGVRFYLHYSIGGQQIRELLKNIPLVSKKDRIAYRESKLIAESIAAERMEEIRKGQLGLTNRHANVLITDWMNHCADKAEKHAISGGSRHTWARMLRHMTEILEQYRPKTTVAQIDKAYVQGFIDFLSKEYVHSRGKHLAPKTADKYYGCLRFALNEAKRDEMIAVNPCELIATNDKIKVPESTRSYLTKDELRALVNTPSESERTRQVFLFMCYCGLRISDVKQLRWEDIERDGDEWRMRKVTQKTQKAAYLPLNKSARQYMPEKGDSEFVFFNLPEEPSMNRALKTWAKNAGITKKVTLHTARHTYATLLLTEGADLYTTSELLNHSNINVTKIYAKIVDEKKRKAVDLLDGIFNQ